MRIAHILWSFTPGGIETMLVDIANEQVKEHQVAIIVVNDVIDERLVSKLDERVNFFSVGRCPGSRSLFPIIRMNIHLWKYYPEIIHCHDDGLVKLIIGRICPMVRTIHNTHSSPKDFSKFRRLCCISSAVMNYTANQGFPNSVIVYNGIHTEIISKRSLPFPLKGKMCKCVCVGRLNPMKGQKVLIEAFNILVNQRHLTNLSLDLIGDGLSKEELTAMTTQYGLESYIRFLGRQPREMFYPKLKDYDLFILPSVSEGFGLTLAEACAAKIPVITCDLEGPMEVIANGRYGRSFKAGDANALANVLVNHIEEGTNVEQVEEAYNYVRTHFDVTVTAQRYVDIYKEVIN